ncbi:hypothetical protein [uncultured Ruegeria sp.]|uniref:hypothetical protein n=1 Tax=uncultured Ruegeria sp. TaxID=259304 RepID=UPI00261F3C1A|nr:hypothetical protein [uncultured Ruegeria sp.]
MNENEPVPSSYYDTHKNWTNEPTAADKHVYEVFASNIVVLVQLLDDYKTMMSPDVYERLFSSLLALSRLLGEYEDDWSQEYPTP